MRIKNIIHNNMSLQHSLQSDIILNNYSVKIIRKNPTTSKPVL